MNTTRGVCPSGWVLPTEADWNALLASVGGEAQLLMSSTLWAGVAEGNTGFNALPGGLTDDDGAGAGLQGEFWPGASSLPAAASDGKAWFWTNNPTKVFRIQATPWDASAATGNWPEPGGNMDSHQHNRASVRCIKALTP